MANSLRHKIAEHLPADAPDRGAARHKLENAEAKKVLYLEYLPKYFSSSAALAKANADARLLARWREEDGGFLVREKMARDQLADSLEAEAIRRAFKGVRKPVYQGGLLAGYVTEYSDQLLTLMLKAMRPERFRDTATVSVNPIVKIVAGFTSADVL